MKQLIEKYVSPALDVLITLTFLTISVLVIALTLLRYLFGATIIGGNEIVRYLFIYTTMLGVPVLFGRDDHVKCDVVIKLFPDWLEKSLYILFHLMVIAFHCYIFYLSLNWIEMVGQDPSSILRFPMKYIQVSIPLGSSLIVLYELANIWQLSDDLSPWK